MAKVTSATVRLVQKKCRANKNGEYPIHIVVCYQGRVEKSTGVSVRDLASVMSRSPNSISTYIHALTRDEDIAEVTSNMAI